MQRLFVIAGASASGKSKFTRALEKKFPLTVLDLDDRLPELLLENKKRVEEIGMEAFLAEIRQFRYDDLALRALARLQKGENVAVVAPFTSHLKDEAVWQNFIKPFSAGSIAPELIWIHVDPKIRAERLKQRGEERDIQKVASPDELARYMAASEITSPVIAHIAIDGAGDFPAQIDYNL